MSYLIEEFDDGNSELIAIEDADDDVDVSDLEIEDADDADAEEVSEEDFTNLVDRITEVIGNCENKDDLGDALLDVLINDFDYTAEDFEDIDDEDISDFEALAFEDEETGDEDAKDADADADAENVDAEEKDDKTAENDDIDECKLTEKDAEEVVTEGDKDAQEASGTELDEGKVGDWIKDKAEDVAYGIEDAATAIHRATPYKRYEEEEDRKYKEWKYRSNGDSYYSGEWRSDYPNANSSYSDYKRYH